MQVGGAGATPANVPSAREVLRAHIPAGELAKVPDPYLDARVGLGTVASEFNRTISVRIEGSGPPSKRALVAQTPAAERLLASKAGPAFERLVRSTMAVGDAAKGHEDLHSLTFLPDEHAMKAVDVLGQLTGAVRYDGAAPALPADPKDAAKAAAQFTRKVAATSMKENNTTLAWNGDGELVIMPDVTRRLFATIGAYTPRTGDPILEKDHKTRDFVFRDDFDTLVHEGHHSVTPEKMYSGAASAWEEAISSVFGLQDRARLARAAGARVRETIEDPGAARDDAGLGWAPWNRANVMPKQTEKQKDQTKVTYHDGPAVVRKLLTLAGIDRRTTEGRALTDQLLESRSARFVPRLVADAIIKERGLDPSIRERLVSRVRESVDHPDGIRHVTELLDTLG